MRISMISISKPISNQIISYRVRKDYGKLIQTICKCCGPTIIYKFFLGELEKAYKAAIAEQGTDISNWSRVECILFCISELTLTLKPEDISLLKDSILLIYQLPNTYLAIRIAATNYITSLSKLLKEQ